MDYSNGASVSLHRTSTFGQLESLEQSLSLYLESLPLGSLKFHTWWQGSLKACGVSPFGLPPPFRAASRPTTQTAPETQYRRSLLKLDLMIDRPVVEGSCRNSGDLSHRGRSGRRFPDRMEPSV